MEAQVEVTNSQRVDGDRQCRQKGSSIRCLGASIACQSNIKTTVQCKLLTIVSTLNRSRQDSIRSSRGRQACNCAYKKRKAEESK